MTYERIDYSLHDGYIHTWLVTGPQHSFLEFGPDLQTPSRRLEALAQRAETTSRDPDFTTQPVERATASDGEVHIGDYSGQWDLFHCMEDHFLDLSDATQKGSLRAWAYTGLESPAPQRVSLTLTTTDFADVWINGEHVHRQLRTVSATLRPPTKPVTGTFQVMLNEGTNDVVVRFETITPGSTPFVLALRAAADQDLSVALPTLISRVDRRRHLEAVFQAAYIQQYVFTQYDKVAVNWPDKGESAVPAEATDTEEADTKTAEGKITIRVQTPAGRVYGEAERKGGASQTAEMGFTYKYPNGQLEALLIPPPEEYYTGDMRVSRTLRFWGLDNEPYTETPKGSFPERRSEALLSAARCEANIYSEIAKMAVGWWSRLELPLILETARRVQDQNAAPDTPSLLGLIGMLMRFGEEQGFPADLRQPIAAAIANARYGEPGTVAGELESRALLSAVCEILGGQLLPDVTFTASGESGQWHQEEGERRALAWIHARATRGFSAPGSDTVYAETILALAHLIDFAGSDTLWEMGAVLLDKILFLLATNCYKGVFGSARGSTTTRGVLGGYLEATSGITKLMWGTGVYNMDFAAPVSLALLQNYELPVMLQTIATDVPEAVWSQEHHDPKEAGATANGISIVAYKTPDFMLSATQDAYPGQAGSDEHAWQATLAPGATVFVNHPVCAGLSDAQRPNFWRGNGARPRVVQWQDALIALYVLPAGDWMGFTHAYFPIHAFDEHVLRGSWAFARKGNGYIALTASEGLSLTRTGHSAYRELRSSGSQNVWLCQMGRTALDGDFAAFQDRVLALPLTYAASDTNTLPGVRWTTLRSDELQLDWAGPFLMNGEITPVAGDHHIANPYCVAPFPADLLDIHYEGTVMRLSFEKQ